MRGSTGRGRARESPLFHLVEQHLEEFLRVYEERFAKQHGPLPPVVERVLRGFKAETAPTKRRCPPSWAWLISKVYQAGLLVCKGCGGPLKIVAYITDESIRRILDHLGLSPPEQEKPPPIREVVPLPVDDEGREIPAG